MKKLLNTLYVLEEDAYLTLDGENVVCKIDGNVRQRIPLSNLEGIICFNYMGSSPALMGKCADAGIALCYISPSGRFLARVQGSTRGNILLRKRQYEMFAKPPVLLRQNTVAAKLYNTKQLIKKILNSHPETDDDGSLSVCIERINEKIDEVYNTDDYNIIMGIEGAGSKAYFSIFNKMIRQQKEEFCFHSRNKRPPLDMVNALLSFLYTILTCDYASALEAVGLDSYYGFYHALRPGRSSLACDLVEETRFMVERFVLNLINLRIVNPGDFEKQVSGAVFLNKDGKKKVLTKWQEKKRGDIIHPYLKQKIQAGLVPYIQSMLLAKYIRGEIDEYPCYLVSR